MPPLRQNQFGGALGGPLVPQPDVLLRQLRRAADAAVADAHVLGADARPCAPATSPASAPICDPLTIPTTGVCTPFAEQPDSRRAASIRSPPAFLQQRRRCRRRAPTLQNLTAVEEQDRDLDQFSVRARSSADGRRPAVRALQHLRRRRAPAVRHQRAAGDAGARLRPVADDADAEPRRQPHARLRQLAAERAARRLDDGRAAARSA